MSISLPDSLASGVLVDGLECPVEKHIQFQFNHNSPSSSLPAAVEEVSMACIFFVGLYKLSQSREGNISTKNIIHSYLLA